jgi:hypothetical protein
VRRGGFKTPGSPAFLRRWQSNCCTIGFTQARRIVPSTLPRIHSRASFHSDLRHLAGKIGVGAPFERAAALLTGSLKKQALGKCAFSVVRLTSNLAVQPKCGLRVQGILNHDVC